MPAVWEHGAAGEGVCPLDTPDVEGSMGGLRVLT